MGRRVIINRLVGAKASEAEVSNITEMSYLLASGSDRIGALDFQASATGYVPRRKSEATCEELIEAASLIEKGVPLTPGLDQALNHRTSIGGARPKALIDRGDRKFIAKFSASGDLYSVVKAEYIAMKLAAACGLDVAPVSIINTGGKDVLLIERFDRTRVNDDWHRKTMVSALTILGLDEMMARYASYEDLAQIIRHRFAKPKETLRELLGRICFNILCGNMDDHARNHAAFWNGKLLTLSPAYDICPQGRTGNEATQAILIKDDNRLRTATCVENQVFVIKTDLSHSTAIHFGQGERFDAVIAGDTESFQVDPIPELGNVLTIKPHMQGASTNMTVITNRRTHSFHLREGAIPGRSGMFFEVRFRYPEDERRAAANAQPKGFEAPRNYSYRVAGEGDFRPTHKRHSPSNRDAAVRPVEPDVRCECRIQRFSNSLSADFPELLADQLNRWFRQNGDLY